MPSPHSKKVNRALIGIAENIALARQFVVGLDATTFATDIRTIYAVTRCLEIISEAVRKLPADLLERHPSVPWSKIKGAGNVYRHEYDNVSPSMLWNTVDTALLDLENAVAAELSRQ
jgi:uncharacterized protein with HEPN domain